MPGSGVATIVVDSLTAIITPLVMKAIAAKESGDIKNLMGGFKEKAVAMRELQDAVTRWGSDVLWVWHQYDARDESAKKIVRESLSPTEVVRLHRSVNAQMNIVTDERGRRGVRVIWCRQGRSGFTLWDKTTSWKGMPEELDVAMYDLLTPEEQKRIAEAVPDVFQSHEAAVAWAVEQEGAFKAITHAQNAYKKLLREHQPITMVAFSPLWVADVRRRQQQPGLLNGIEVPEPPVTQHELDEQAAEFLTEEQEPQFP